MDAALKTEIQEIVELVKTIPEQLQLRAFEILLQDALDRSTGKKRTHQRPEEEEETKEKGPDKDKRPERQSEGLDATMLPMRVKAFMKKHEVTAKQLERLFHIEGKEYEPIWTVEATKFSKAQVQIALLHALQRGLTSGEFSFEREEVKKECKERGSYSEGNFNANFQNSSKFFSGLDKGGLVSLTDDGMKALANLVPQLAGTGDAK